MSRRFAGAWLACVAFLLALPALADTRVTLSKDAVAPGETVVLTIETDQPVASPDLRPLHGDFGIGDIGSSRQVSFDGKGMRASQQIRIELKPLRSGMLAIPALSVGNQRTAPLVLEVATRPGARAMAPGRSSVASTQANAPVFIDTVFDDATPYVQQAVGITVRLHYAINLFNGEFRQPEPQAGASLQPMGSDGRSVRMVNGREYQVLERHYLLLPERSGVLRMPGASFTGEGESGFFDGLFGDGRDPVSVQAPARSLQVRAIPASAGRPWLPARQVSMRVASPPTQARAGEAFDVVVELHADGAMAMQLPEIQLMGDHAQVFAQPAQPTEDFANGRPQAVLVRRFSIVPQQAGTLRLQVSPVAWWDTAVDAPRRAEVTPMIVKVAPGSGRYAAANPPMDAQPAPTTTPAETGAMPRLRPVLPWVLGTAALALIALLAWWLSRRRSHVRDAESIVATPGTSTDVASTSRNEPGPAAAANMADFRRAVQTGDLAAVARLLPSLSQPPSCSLAAARDHLEDPQQAEALARLEQALWGDGDADAARAVVRRAFAKGPGWKASRAQASPLLPPLYPEH